MLPLELMQYTTQFSQPHHSQTIYDDYAIKPTTLSLSRDWSKSIGGGGGGGPKQRGGGSSVFEPLVRGGSCNF